MNPKIFDIISAGLLSFFIFCHLLLFIFLFEALEFIGLIFFLSGGIIQYVILSPLFDLFAFPKKSNKKALKTNEGVLGIFGLIMGILLFFIFFSFSFYFKMTLLSLFWFPFTSYLGLAGLFRWWVGLKNENISPFLRGWLKIEGLSTFIYSLGLVVYGFLFWNFVTLLFLSGLTLISGGISFILLGVVK
jgi:hypothetical protein